MLNQTKKLTIVLDSTHTNRLLFAGRLYIPHVIDQLIRFRFYKFWASFDIIAMYFSVGIKLESDQSLFQFIYRNPKNNQDELMVYCFQYIVMGSRDASFQTSSAVREIADNIEPTKPEVANILRQMYADDGNA